MSKRKITHLFDLKFEPFDNYGSITPGMSWHKITKGPAAKKMNKEQENELYTKLKSEIDSQGSVYYSSARLWDDGVIKPADARKVLGMSLHISMDNYKHEDTKFGVFRM